MNIVSNITIQERTEQFAIRVIDAYVQINKHNHFSDAVSVLSKQFLRSGTSIGANCPKGYRSAYVEAVYAQ